MNRRWRTVLAPYFRIARVDHWVKNAFMLLGVLLAYFYAPQLFTRAAIPALVFAVLATCLVTSSNYVLNELLDAPFDRLHPVKRERPAARGEVKRSLALAEWLLLAAAGIGLAFALNRYFGLAALALWGMGIVYNVPPLRTKDHAYVDVLSESLNNPLRLLLGWHALVVDRLPPLSLLLAYWMAGAFFMAIKRFAEYRSLADPEVAAAYRSSFRHYDEDRLLVSVFFYAVASAIFLGVFIVRYKLELVLAVPVVAGFFAFYLRIGLRPESPVQSPERLHRERGFVAYAVATTAIFVLLMFSSIPELYELFNVPPASFAPLWRLGE
jgi:decaprenyl-phosphate phosphoribosyltransferase